MSLFDFDRPADRYAVMGNPVSHSKSPLIHGMFAKQTGQQIEYTAIQVDPGGFVQAVGNFEGNGGRGLNVTVPFKEEAYRLADTLSERAKLAGAVNTLLLSEHGVRGDNTDGAGFVQDLCVNHEIEIKNRRILILGAGGASRGILAPILQKEPEAVWIANRTEDKALDMVDHFRSVAGTVMLNGSGFQFSVQNKFDLVVNATACSLKGIALELADDLLTTDAVCYDLMYGMKENTFFNWAQSAGATICIDGLGMLVEQAAESFLLWRGVRPNTKPVLEHLRHG